MVVTTSEDIKTIKGWLKMGAAQLATIDIQVAQKQLLSVMTDLGVDGNQKTKLVANLLVNIHDASKDRFFDVISPLFDLMRNNPAVDLFSAMLANKMFTTKHLATVYQRALNTGAMTVFDIEAFLPRTAPKTKQALLLGRMFKQSGEGVLQDTICDHIVKLVLPEGMTLDPASMMDVQAMSKMMSNMGLLGMLHKQNFPVAPVINRIGEQQGPQIAMFVLLMLSQSFIDEAGIQAIIKDMENEMFSNMFSNARKMMGDMMKGMAGKGGMPGLPGMTGMPAGGLPGLPVPRLPGSSIIARLMARLLKFFGRFRRA